MADVASGRALLIATAGGHLTQLISLAHRLGLDPAEAKWATVPTTQSRSILSGRDVVWADYSSPRDLRGFAGHLALARRVTTREDFAVAISTGASLAPPFLAVARSRGIASLTDLARQAPGLRLGSDLEFLRRPEWQAVRTAYGLRFASSRSYSPTFMYRALESGDVDLISAFSSDGRIAADRLAVLTDPKGAAPGYDALLLVSPAHAHDQRFIAALAPLIGAIPVAAMQRANYLVDRDREKFSPQAAARVLAAGLAKH